MIRNIALAAALTFTACAPAHAADRDTHRQFENKLRSDFATQTQGASQQFLLMFCDVNAELASTTQDAVAQVGILPLLDIAARQDRVSASVISYVALLDFKSKKAAESSVYGVCMESAR